MKGLGAHIVLVTALALCALAGQARAQLAASAAVDSDYRFRGLTLSQGQPDLRLNLSFDHKSGAYGGISLITSQGYDGDRAMTGDIEYAGVVSARRHGLAWEAGVTHSHIQGRGVYDYSEVYGGMLGEHFSARLSWSPSYYGRNRQTLYADFSTSARLSSHWRVFGHAGALTPLSGPTRRERYDVRGGVAADIGRYEVQVAWTKTNPLIVYPATKLDDGEGIVVSLSAFF